MNPDNIRVVIFGAVIVAIVLIANARSVLNSMSDARRAKYLARVCEQHKPLPAAKEDPEP